MKYFVLKNIFGFQENYTNDEAHRLVISTRSALFHMLEPDAAQHHESEYTSASYMSAHPARRTF